MDSTLFNELTKDIGFLDYFLPLLKGVLLEAELHRLKMIREHLIDVIKEAEE